MVAHQLWSCPTFYIGQIWPKFPKLDNFKVEALPHSWIYNWICFYKITELLSFYRSSKKITSCFWNINGKLSGKLVNIALYPMFVARKGLYEVLSRSFWLFWEAVITTRRRKYISSAQVVLKWSANGAQMAFSAYFRDKSGRKWPFEQHLRPLKQRGRVTFPRLKPAP